jgi:GNAT superfamily N-acetyltransferase
MDAVTFDEMRADDAAEVAALAGQLGYPCPAEDILSRMDLFSKEPAEQLRVARLGSRVVGWVHFQLRRSLSTGPRVEIAAVVVEQEQRGKGIGGKLCGLAEEWGRAQGLKRIRLSSRATRTDAHRLYLKLGYLIDKTSHVFSKPLAGKAPESSLHKS